MKCPNCQTDLPDVAKFCNQCGKSLHSEIICSRYQHPNQEDSSFCLSCGQSLTIKAPSPPTPAKQAPSPALPTSFANGCYKVNKFLGEGGSPTGDGGLDRIAKLASSWEM